SIQGHNGPQELDGIRRHSRLRRQLGTFTYVPRIRRLTRRSDRLLNERSGFVGESDFDRTSSFRNQRYDLARPSSVVAKGFAQRFTDSGNLSLPRCQKKQLTRKLMATRVLVP